MGYEFERHASAQQNFRRTALEQIERSIAEIEGVGSLHERVHSVRKRGKKLRALLRLVRPVFAGYARENAALRDAAAGLSVLRDAEALIETLDPLVAEAQAVDTHPEVRAFLVGRRDRLEAQEDTAAVLRAFRETLETMRERAERWKLSEGGFDGFAGGLVRTYGEGRDAMKTARRDPTAFHLHEWRKRVKAHAYHSCLLRAAAPDLLRGHREAALHLGELLGDHHNLAVLRETIEGEPDLGGAMTPLAAGIDARQATLATEAFALGRKVFAERPAALGRRWRAYWQAWHSVPHQTPAHTVA